MARPLIARRLVEIAREVGADAVAHGCTGKGNDQVRFDVAIGALAPDLKVLTPAREWGMSREGDHCLRRALWPALACEQALPLFDRPEPAGSLD